MKKILFLLFVSVSVFGWGQGKLSPQTIQFLNDVKRAKTTGSYADYEQRKVSGSCLKNATEVPVFIHLDGTDDLSLLEDAGVRIRTIAGDWVTAKVLVDKIPEIANLRTVKYIEIATPVQPKMNEAKRSVKADLMHSGAELPNAFRGKDVVIGIIDMGFEYGHLNFWNDEKNELRVKRVWNQNQTGNSPSPYDYGAEYTTQESILQAIRDTIISTHGTHVAGIAAGSIRTEEENYSGIAPEADIVFVSLNTQNMPSGDNTAVIDGINYIFNYAESVRKPCVINMSLGSHIGPHDGTSTFDQMADLLQGPGKLLVGAVGNEGTDKFHASKTFRAEQKDTLKTFIVPSWINTVFPSLEIWGDAGMEFSFIPFVYSIEENKVVISYDPITVSPEKAESKNYEFSDFMRGEVFATGEINPHNQKPHLVVSLRFFLSTTHRMGFYIVSKDNGTVHVWTDNFEAGLGNFGLSEFTDGDSNYSMGEIGGTGKRIISVGAYVSRDHYSRYGIPYFSGEKLNSIASFSSKGPTADGRMKPDVSAPGSYIISSLSGYYTDTKLQVPSVEWNGQQYELGYMQGSSMASPLVTGVLAVWLQANSQLTPERVREIMKQTSVEDQYTGNLSDEANSIWGYGKIDAWNGLKECIQQTGLDEVVNDLPSVVLVREGKEINLLFTQKTPIACIQLYNANGVQIYNRELKGIEPGDEDSIYIGNISAGIYFMKIICNNRTISQKLIIP